MTKTETNTLLDRFRRWTAHVSRYVLSLALMILAVHSAAKAGVASDSARQAALALEQQGKNSEAEAAWRAYLKTHPSDPEPYARLGLLEARQKRYKEAVPLYRKALAMSPGVPGLRLNLGLALFKAGELKQAIPEFNLSLQQAPAGSPEAQRLKILIGMSHYGLAEYAEAAPFLKEAAAGDAQNLPLRLALAHSCLWSKQYQCVLDVYHEILTLDSESAEADMLAGEALDELKDSQGATRMFRAAVTANPKEPNVHFGLGYLLFTQRIYAEAIREFQVELALEPDHVQAMLYLADTYVQLGQPAEARPLLEKVVQLDPTQSLAHLDLGILLSDAGRNDEALRELTLAEKLNPQEVNVHWRLGRLYRTLGKKDLAKAEFDKASNLNKAADEDLFKKISGGRPRPPQDTTPPAATTPQQ
jgi:tetratricopeptide (TPR) repeat protein